MSAKKIVAILAVIVMITCPLAVAFVNTDAASEKTDVVQNGTHVKFTNLTKSDVESIFFPDKKVGSDDITIKFKGATYLYAMIGAAVLLPNINAFGVNSIEKYDFDNVDIEVSYARQTVDSTSSNVKVALDINVKNYSITLNTIKGLPVLMSDVLADGEKAADFYGIYMEMLEKAFEKATEEEKEEIKALIEFFEDLETSGKLNKMMMIIKLINSFMGNGDYAKGIREAYQGEVFTGESITASGDLHATLYVESDFALEIIDKVKNTGESGLDEFVYSVFTKSGLVIGNINPLQNGGSTDPMTVLQTLPISDIALSIKHHTTLECKGLKTVEIDNDINAEIAFQASFNYALPLTKSNIAKGVDYTVEMEKAKLHFDIVTDVSVDGKNYSGNEKTIDLSNLIESMFNGMMGVLNETSFTKSHDTSAVGSNLVAVTPMMYAYYFPEVCSMNGEKQSNAIDDFVEMYDIPYAMIIWGFTGKSISELRDSTLNAQAMKTIEGYNGEYSHDYSVCNNAASDIEDVINGKESKDNSMLILAIVVVVIAILAIIAFAMIVRHRA